MKHLKKLGLLVMATASLMAFIGSASAATFTSPTGTAYTGAFSMSLEGSLLKKAGFAETTCTASTISGNFTTNNDTHVIGPITSVTYGTTATPCTSPQGTPKVTTNSSVGTITINKATTVVTGTGVDVTEEVIGISCTYGMGNGTTLGTAKNTVVNGVDKVTLAINAKLPGTPENGFFCANPAAWTGSYVFTTPSPSFVD